MNRELKIAKLTAVLTNTSEELKKTVIPEKQLKLLNKFLSVEKEIQIQQSYLATEGV